jgi:hypothetical protein
MRFAGQQFRNPEYREGRFTAKDYAEGDYTYRYSAPGLSQSRAVMPEVNVSSMAKIQQRPFSIPDFSEPEFRA